ncbi:hypothetical protein BD408DRAFT_446598 [Parasitella parasitica]|nr:hypothetical protein BD408DRAFT_446598 [Parasitella parasitica]
MYIQKLPFELFHATLNCIDSLQQLANCRLVCKSWNIITQQVMLSRKINIATPTVAGKLYKHLKRVPEYGKLVKYMDIGIHYQCSLYEKLLGIALTPNMIELEGIVDNCVFYELVLAKLDKSPEKFDRLKCVPHPIFISKSYCKLVLALKESLEKICIGYEEEQFDLAMELTSNLDAFTCLTTLDIRSTTLSLDLLDLAISKCHRLLKLSLDLDTVYVWDGGLMLGDCTVSDWILQNQARKIPSTLAMLECSGSIPEVLEFVLFKYSKIQHAIIRMPFFNLPFPPIDNLLCVLTIVTEIPTFEVMFPFAGDDLDRIFAHVKNCDRDIQMEVVSQDQFTVHMTGCHVEEVK